MYLVLLAALLLPAVPTPSPAEGSRPQVHTVRKGETLRTVSGMYDVPVKELRHRNGLPRKARLKPGSQLVIRASIPETHTATEGEALWGVARRYGLDLDALMDWIGLDSEELPPGQRLSLVAPDDSTLPVDAVKLPTGL